MALEDVGIARARSHHFASPWGKLFWMLVVAGGVAAASWRAWEMFPGVREPFLANPYLNSVIIGVLVLGVLYAFKQIIDVFGASGWLRRFLSAGRHDDPGKPPDALSPMAELLSQTPGEMRLSAVSARSMLDSLASRLAEAGEVNRYLARLLIFLGLLGTFWGLLETLGGVVGIVGALSSSTDGSADVSVLFERLQGPLDGMATAFSSSILGVAGSLILGLLDLLANQAQSRFYNDVENWLAKISRVGIAPLGDGGGGGAPAYVNSILDRMAESLDSLQSVVQRAEESRVRANEALAFLSTELSALNDRLGRQDDALQALRERAGDDTITRHARNIDASLQRLVNEAVNEREVAFRDLRNEIRALAKALTSGSGGAA